MSDSIFNDQTTGQSNQNNDAATNASGVQNNDAVANLLSSIKNERGEPKYKDVQTALDALRHSQDFIPQIKQENDTLKSELDKLKEEVARLKTVEDTVSKLTSVQNVSQQTPASVSGEDIVKLIDQALTQKESMAKQKANTEQVVAQISQSFGAEAEKTFYSKAAELGISANDLNALAAKSPEAVLQLFGIKKGTTQQSSFKSNTQSSVNTDGYQPQNTSFIGRNAKPVILGATTQDLLSEQENAKGLVKELHEQGLTTYALTDPKKYFQQFK